MSRELPIHNGRMTTDLDANGFKIKNLPPGSGFTQAQADWNQADATAPDFIKNKPTIPAAVTIDATLTQQGAAADAKAVGDALRGGFTEWVCDSVSEGYEFVGCEWVKDQYMTDYAWRVGFVRTDSPLLVPTKVVIADSTHDAVSLSLADSTLSFSLSRHLITPTKTSQLTNDGDGTNAFVKTNDSRLSDARTPTAHTHAMADVTGLNAALVQKADAADLPYALVEPGKWSVVPATYQGEAVTLVWDEVDVGVYAWDVRLGGQSIGVQGSLNHSSLSEEFFIDTTSFVATRPSLPGHLLDRAGNRVVVTGDTTLTLPAAVPGYCRDFLVRLEISGSTVPTITFAAPTGETITYETDGDEFPVPDEAGTCLYSFTETAASTFAVALKKVNTVAQGGA